MKTLWILMPLALVGLFFSMTDPASGASSEEREVRAGAQKEMKDGNYQDAYSKLRELALDAQSDPFQVSDDLTRAVECLNRLNRANEIDALVEGAVKAHAENWRLLQAASRCYLDGQHVGFMIAGKFERGHHRGGGNLVNSAARDRARALQLMKQAMPRAQQEGTGELVAGRPSDRRILAEVSNFFETFALMMLGNRGGNESWRLQYLTDLDVLPDYEPGWGGYYGGTQGAPVDEQGKPIYYTTPPGFDAAANDGQRWRWCLAEAAKYDASREDRLRLQFADFLRDQFGPQTMAEYGWPFGREATDDSKENESGTYALATLGEDETVARLATGIKRFTLPDEFNYIKIYQEIAADRAAMTGVGADALERLVAEFENRRQYPKAAEYCRKLVEVYRERQNRDAVKNWQARLDQIVGNWGRFEPVSDQPAGQGATVEYRFRNGRRVSFTAHEINVEQLLEDAKKYLKSRPAQIDGKYFDVENLGYRLVYENQRKYVGRKVAAWDLDLEPREKHFDKRVTVATPLVKPGAYLLSAKMDDGNTSLIILWVADMAIVQKRLADRNLYYVADATTGRPVAKANVEFFGYRQRWTQNRRYQLDTKQFAEYTDADGQVTLDPGQQNNEYQWLVIARTGEGRLAYLGFSGAWFSPYHRQEYAATKVYTITDRPVYRPKQKVNYKFWVANARYDAPARSPFAGRTFTVEVRNPKNEKVVDRQVTADQYGGMAGSFELAEDAPLGVWSAQVRDGDNHLGGGSFRVEEYKKPEFEVSVAAPEKPVMLGEKIKATVKAKYYFGSPVTQAKVKYKITRASHDDRWYPVMPWDWLYGPGYWWFGGDYDWYPGWTHWGWACPRPMWWRGPHMPPEVVAERTVDIGPNGEVEVEIDTELAKAIHPDQDHCYTITAEVTDQSRRTIVGTGTVLVARRPFSICAWVDRGYYRVGDTVGTHFAARTLDGRGVEGKGKLALLKITYQNDKPVETPVQTWNLDTDNEGRVNQQMTASEAGRYRLSYTLTDTAGHTIEGGHLFTVIGAGFDGRQFRFSHLELVPDKQDYKPGEKVQLQINTDRVGSTVLLFLRPSNGVYLAPKTLRLDGKSTVVPIGVQQGDMPNFFVEAVTVADGRVHTETRQIVVPPERRVLSVDVEPSADAYKPGQKAKVKVRLTDLDGKPFVGSTVISIYDKSVEYISGGSNVPEIKAFFWKWQRHHYPQTTSNLGRMSDNLVERDAVQMGDLGIFGATQVEELGRTQFGLELRQAPGARRSRMGGMGMGGGMGGMAMGGEMAMPKMAMAAPAASPMADGAVAEDSLAMAEAEGAEGAGAASLVEPTVRTKFADTALWVADLTTKDDGTADVELDMPENLTTWRIKAWAMGGGARVGQGQTDVVTRKDLIIRMQTPRFFVQGDRVTLSANVHNYLDSEKNVQVTIELDGPQLVTTSELLRTVGIAPGGEKRINWWVNVKDEGEAVIRMKALTDEESDAMEMRVPCYVHGMLKTESYSGSIRPDGDVGTITVEVPKDRRPAQSRLEVRYSPTLAGAMVDALPYLVDYPYGCTEQTLSRFLPTVIVQKILIDKGIDLEAVQKKRTNLNAQEIGDDTKRAEQWKRYKRNPVFDTEEVRRMVKDGVNALTQMQCSDGGWGWFSGWGEQSYPHTTTYVVHGLQIARANDVALVPGVMERGVAWLTRYQDEQVARLRNAELDPKNEKKRPQWKHAADNLDAFVYMVLVDAGVVNDAMRDYLYRDRNELAVYSKAMYGLALEKQGEKDKLAMILRNLGQYLQQDDENQTAWLNLPGGYWWCWYGSEYEAQAYYLKLLCRTDPKGEVAARLVKYLLNNRKNATYWNSTRDTAICIEAMADFLKASGEDRPAMTVEVYFDGKLQKAVEITPDNLFDFDNKLVLTGDQLSTGRHTIELRRKGRGPLYYNAYQTNFTLEDFIKAAGLEIKVQRKYYRLKPVEATVKAAGSRGQAVDQRVEKYERAPLANLAELTSGDLVEIELELESKNDYEYLVFEDMKPAGFEPVEVRSGYNGNELGAYVEFRDNRVVFLVRQLARGKHSVSYRMRAEIPGRFSALPTRGSAMYAPELKANSEEIKLGVVDAPE
ncbi:MAG TPA: MG2 domain-containing protein [Thermoguttaceae bacterium]|nr:MG2 domain-containing protein [Thermoguttaceae bacterium]